METRKQVAREAHVEVLVPAPVEAVWRVIIDVTRTGEWSHECHRVEWLHGATSAAPGAQFRGRNRAGIISWARLCQVRVVDPPRQLVWSTMPTWLIPDSTQWRISLQPSGGGTRIVQEFRVTQAPAWWAWLAARLIPTHHDRTAALAGDLRRLGEVAAEDVRASAAQGTGRAPVVRDRETSSGRAPTASPAHGRSDQHQERPGHVAP